VVAQIEEARKDTSIARRPLIKRAALGAAGPCGAAVGILAVGPFVRNPWEGGDLASLSITGWKPLNGEIVYLRDRLPA